MKNSFLYNISARPLRSIEYILSTAALLFGIYVLSPWYIIEQSIGTGTVFDIPLFLAFLGAAFVVVGAFSLYGLIKNNTALRAYSLYLLFMALIFISVLRAINFGLFPMIWFFPAICSLIAGILYIKLRMGDEIWTQR